MRDCIASTSAFASYSIPALLDKLDSTSINVKRDALQAITSCVQRYGAATINLYSITLWDALKFEILNAQEDDLTEEALTALEGIARQLSTSPHPDALETYIKPIAKECNEHLEDTPTKQSAASARILKSVSVGSREACNSISELVLPQVFAFYRSSDSLPRRRGLLEVFNALLQANLTMFGQWRKKGNIAEDGTATAAPVTLKPTPNSLSAFNETAARALTVALTATPAKEVSFRLLVLEILTTLATIRQILDDTAIAQVIRTLDDIVIKEESFGRDELKAAAIDALVEMAHQKPQLLIESAFPDFMAQLPDTDVGYDKPYVPVLEAFAKLGAEAQVFKTIIVRLKNKFYAAARQNASTRYLVHILSAMLYAFTKGSPSLGDASIFGGYYQDIVIPLLKDTRTLDGGLRAFRNVQQDTVLDLIGRICNAIVRTQQWVAQTEICRNVYTLFQPAELTSKAPFTTTQSPLDPGFQDMLISTHLLASLQREARPHTNIADLLSATVKFASDISIPPTIKSAAVDQVALLVSKFIATTESEVLLSAVSSLIPSASPDYINPQHINIAFSILHAAILRTHRTVPTLLQSRFLPLLTSTAHGPLAAHHFSTLLAPSPLLTKENHCQIFNLHKQRLFALTVPTLITTFRNQSTTPEAKRNVLIALSGLLYYIPYDLLRAQKSELENLVPLLLQSLTLSSSDANDDAFSVRQRAITLVERIVLDEQSRDVLASHVQSLTTRLLDIATGVSSHSTASASIPSHAKLAKVATRSVSAESPTAQARITPTITKDTSASGDKAQHDPPKSRAAALACLSSFPSAYKTETLLPHKMAVVRRLMACLDDGKRVVRAEAVRCRRSWESGVAGTEGDDDDD